MHIKRRLQRYFHTPILAEKCPPCKSLLALRLYLCYKWVDMKTSALVLFFVMSAFASMEASADWFYGPTGSNIGRVETDAQGNTRYYDKTGSFIGSGRKDATGSVRYYDKTGSYAGKSEASGNSTRYYDKTGSYAGKAEHSGNSTRYYDKTGSYAGKAEQSGNSTRYYDKKGSHVGSKRR